MSKYGIFENELCNKDFIYKKITNLPELCDNDNEKYNITISYEG